MTLEDLRKRFKYRKDDTNKWKVMDAEKGPLYGDCEDFAVTALWILSDRSWTKFWWKVTTLQAVVWKTTVNGEGHIMLWVKGKGWIDNIYPYWSPTPRHKKVFPYIVPMLAAVIAAGKV